MSIRRIAFILAAITETAIARPSVRDPDLARYVSNALAHNRELLARSADVDAKVEAIHEARAAYLPNVTADARYTKFWGALDLGDLINPAYAALNQVLGQPRFPTDLELTLPLALEAKVRIAQPLYVPQLGPAYRLSKLAAESERRQRSVARREIVAAVATVYYTHARASQLAKLLRDTRPLLEENLAVSTALVRASRSTNDVVLRAKAELAAHDQRLRTVEQGARAAARALNLLIGAPIDAPVASPQTLPLPIVPDDINAMIAEAHAQRGELKLLGIASRASSEQRELARAGYFPTISVAVDLGIQRADLGASTDDTYAAVSVVGSWNLFDGGRDRSRVLQREHEQRAIAARRAELSDRIAADVSSAWEAARVAQAAVTTADDRIASTDAAYSILARRYAANDVPQLEVLVAENALIAARTDRIVAITELYMRLVDLDRIIASDEVSP